MNNENEIAGNNYEEAAPVVSEETKKTPAPRRRSGERKTGVPLRRRNMRKEQPGDSDRRNEIGHGLKIIPLGGLEQIGMNITAFEYEDSIIVVDCGLSFPEDDMLGIDLVIPDVTYLKENLSKV